MSLEYGREGFSTRPIGGHLSGHLSCHGKEGQLEVDRLAGLGAAARTCLKGNVHRPHRSGSRLSFGGKVGRA
jgi:hypothetical protein